MISHIIDIHANGKQIILKAPIGGLDAINPTILNGYISDKVLSDTDREYVQSRPILCMPVHRSPLLTRNVWAPKYTDSLTSLTMLRAIQSCYSINEYLAYTMEHRERIDAATTAFKADIAALDSKLFDKDLAKFYAENECDKDSCTLLVLILEQYTLDLINLFERCIYAMFIPDFGSVEMFLTPQETPYLSELLPADQQKLLEKSAMLFKTKDIIQNTRLTLSGCKTRQFFSDTDSEIKYKNYLGQQRIIEYFAFLNINHD